MYLNLLTVQQDNSKDYIEKFDSNDMLSFSSAKKKKAGRDSDIGSHLVMEPVRGKSSESSLFLSILDRLPIEFNENCRVQNGLTHSEKDVIKEIIDLGTDCTNKNLPSSYKGINNP